VVVLEAGAALPSGPLPADAVVSRQPERAIAVVTADCVPVLIAGEAGASVAAIHAGWRGLAAGILDRAMAAFRRVASDGEVRAVIGPHIGPCCYEVDRPVLDALGGRFPEALPEACATSRSDHALLDLGALTRAALQAVGVASSWIGEFPGACTRCQPERYFSHRRDPAEKGRMTHWVKALGRGA
jgi:YfiH family protein